MWLHNNCGVQIVRLSCCALTAVALCCAGADANSDAVNIKCRTNDFVGADVNIAQLWNDKFQILMYCIDAEFISDITPCAPNHGYSESAITGSADIVKIGYDDDFPYLVSSLALHVAKDDRSIVFTETKANFDTLLQVWKFEVEVGKKVGVAEVGGHVVNYVCSIGSAE